jgi:long-chain acyl-CoA synthetase
MNNQTTTANLADQLARHAALQPNHPALYTPDSVLTFGQLDVEATRVARHFVARGLHPGARVAVHWHNSLEAAILFYAAFRAQVILVPVNLRMKPAEIAYVLHHSGASLCFSAPALAPTSREATASLNHPVEILTALPEGHADAPLPASGTEKLAAILYTSGTTANPKGACLTHDGMIRGCQWADSFEFFGDAPVALVASSMMHILALFVVISSINRGGSAALLATLEAAPFLEAVERFRCTGAFVLPVMLRQMTEEQAARPRDISSFRHVFAGGDAVATSVQQRFREVFGLPVREAYGMTEAGLLSMTPAGDIRPGSMGVETSVARVRIVDPEGNDVAPGQTGEVIVKSVMSCAGYWNDPAATEELYRGGWLHTGDLASIDNDGYLWFKGRLKQIIVRGGSNISPQEVEEALCRHSAIREAAVVGCPDPVFGESVTAFLSVFPGCDIPGEDEIRAFVRRILADYKVPTAIHFRAELPKGLTGKIHRRVLREDMLAAMAA